jgi:DNA ligase (NAD+)
MEELELGIGDKIEVYKANMIIPQIASNLTKSGVKDIPRECPACGGQTEIRQVSDAKSLYCTNPECGAKHLKSFALFVSRDALNMDGLSEATLEKFIAKGFIHSYSDIFHLDRYEEEIKQMEGFGEKSYDKLQKSIEKARTTTLPRLIYGLGIANIGLANAKVICKEFRYDVERMIGLTEEDLNSISGIGPVIAKAYVEYFSEEKHVAEFRKLLHELIIPEEEVNTEAQIFENMIFVITGSVEHFTNRNEVKDVIESKGGKVTGSVTAKTNYLINNDVNSTSSKNKKAKELGIPIITEEEFINMLNQ